MFRRNLYYTFKPILPRRLRRAVRGVFVRRKLKQVAGVWPILESAGETPPGWPGWPDGKRFAFVLTHDVEGAEGLSKVRQLAELEMSLGFRSSFNFVPEGEYSVPSALRSWLTENGFEVGVHDLHHDGHLYRSREEFARRARKINGYLKEWGVGGYRSGFMLHNYAWHHDLEVAYDATSFDTDPFEPQPDGVGTIFPFFVPRPAAEPRAKGQEQSRDSEHSLLAQRSSRQFNTPRSGYVELPYTLPQDSTLFFLLGETSDQIWRKKVDWVAGKGGMALLNTHPDYMHFGPGPADAQHFSVEIYAAFLRYLSTAYAKQYWNPLPKEIAQFSKPHVPIREPRERRRIGMITYSHYEYDNRVRRYAEALAARGDEVEVLAVCPGPDAPREIWLEGVHVTRLVPKQRLKESVAAYSWQVFRFCLAAGAVMAKRSWTKRYDLMHVHNMPDFVVFAALVPKLFGARVILDLHDLVPELFHDKLSGWKSKLAGWFLRLQERVSAAFADHVIISNHLWVEDIVARSAKREKCSVFINNVDTRVFRPHTRTRTDDRKIILFHGSVSHHQGVDLVISAMPAVLERVPNAEFHIYGGSAEMPALEEQARRLGIEHAVKFNKPVYLHEMPQIIANADLGVVAKRADGFGNRAYSTKIMEFLSQGIPAVLSRTEIDQFYFDESVARFFDSGDVAGLAERLSNLLTDDSLRSRLGNEARDYVRRNGWGTRKETYLQLVDALVESSALPENLHAKPEKQHGSAKTTSSNIRGPNGNQAVQPNR